MTHMKKEVFTSVEMPFDQIQRVQAIPQNKSNPDGWGVTTVCYLVEEFRHKGEEAPRRVNAEEFENEYRSIHRLSFGEAFEALKKGLKISFEDWENTREYLQISQQFEDEGQENPKVILWRIGEYGKREFVRFWDCSHPDTFENKWQISEQETR